MSNQNLKSGQVVSFLTRGNHAFQEGKYSEAIKYYEEAINKTPELQEAITINIAFARRKLNEISQDDLLESISFAAKNSNKKPNDKLTEKNDLVIRSGRDAFMLRGLKPLAPIAVVLDTEYLSDFEDIFKILACITDSHDLFVLGDFEKYLPYIQENTLSITDTGLTDTKHGRAFLRLASSNVFDEYRGVLWLTPGIANEGTIEEFLPIFNEFDNDSEWGISSNLCNKIKITSENERLLSGLRTALPRLGLKFQETEIAVPSGEVIWIKPILLRGLGVSLRPDELQDDKAKNGYPGRSIILGLLSALAKEAGFDVRSTQLSKPKLSTNKRQLKTIAFYLPQFHPIPENDLWWGKGFTEWTNVTRGRQLFRGHYQPRIPTELGYYDLRLEETLIAQAELAREFGLNGFCFYYYWFGGKKLLNQPIELISRSKKVDIGFCVCWANENWSRNWDGQNRHVLMEQTYSLESNIALIRELIPMMKDPRWIRHNGKPVMMVYRISIIPNWTDTALAWREECRKAGLGEIHLCAVRFGLETLKGSPQDHGLDSYVLFPPHESTRVDLRDKVLDLHKDFNGQIFDYSAVVDGDLASFENGYEWPVHRGAMLGWDNTARRLTDARIFHGATPFGFRRWMKGILEQEQKLNKNDESLVFINAWNEWAEGTYLEPDQRWGRSYLRALSSAVESVPSITTNVLPSGVAAQPRGTTALEKLGNPKSDSKSLAPPEWNEGARTHNTDWPTIMLCAHISGQHLFGGERSLLDVLKAFSELPVNVVMTLPSGNNSAYVREVCMYSLGVYVFPYPQWREDRSNYAWLTNTFADIIARHAVDVVHANTIVLIEPLEAAARMGCTRIIHSRELISLDDPLCKQIGLGVTDIIQSVFQRSDWIIANSQATSSLFWRNKKTHYVPNAVNIEDFDLGNNFGNTIKFGIVSSNIPKKGVADFVEVARLAAARTKRAQFLIIGPVNDQLNTWQNEITEGTRPNNLVVAGYAESPRKAMSQINVLLSLSHFAESFGRTVAEAMASRRPVIAYDWGAIAELVQHEETGYLLPYRNIDGVVDAVVSLCENDSLIKSMGEAGRRYVGQHFAQANLKSALADAYSTIMARPVFDKQFDDSTLIKSKKNGLPPVGTTIIIPVYNAPEAVRDCIRSVLEHTDLKRNRLLVIDDASPDPEVRVVLDEFKNTSGVKIIKNSSNIGYTKTVNRGIRESGADDIVLLNSDTVVTPRWLEGLRCAAYSAPKIGTVTAMSDNAGAFSFPKFNEYCPRPEGMSHDEYALLVTQKTQYCKPPEVPTGSGFCFYIRRAMIDECGVFDEKLFPRGYGEENDFCMRGGQMGWKHLISPWSFVFHVRSASFKGEKASLVKAGVDAVIKKFPTYTTLVKKAFMSDEMMKLRESSRILGVNLND